MSFVKHTTLLLNANAEPLRLTCWERAFTLTLLNKVSVLDTYDIFVHSQYCRWPIPAVVISHRFHTYYHKVKLDHKRLYARDGWTCQYCGKRFLPRELTWDHVIPKSKNGATVWTNLVTACVSCNMQKGNRTPNEANMKLLAVPKEPKWLPLILVQMIKYHQVPEQWKPWINWIK